MRRTSAGQLGVGQRAQAVARRHVAVAPQVGPRPAHRHARHHARHRHQPRPRPHAAVGDTSRRRMD